MLNILNVVNLYSDLLGIYCNSWKKGRALCSANDDFSIQCIFQTIHFSCLSQFYGQACDLPLFFEYFKERRVASSSSGAALVIV